MLSQRQPRYESEPLRLLCRRAEGCYLKLDGCTGTPTAAAHSNWQVHGRGLGYKSHDVFTVPACFACHQELDYGKVYTLPEKRAAWMNAWEAWMLDIWRNGWAKVNDDSRS